MRWAHMSLASVGDCSPPDFGLLFHKGRCGSSSFLCAEMDFPATVVLLLETDEVEELCYFFSFEFHPSMTGELREWQWVRSAVHQFQAGQATGTCCKGFEAHGACVELLQIL